MRSELDAARYELEVARGRERELGARAEAVAAELEEARRGAEEELERCRAVSPL